MIMSDCGGLVDQNIARQFEEIEALTAIYDADFITRDLENKTYEIWIKNEQNPKYSASLRIVLPPLYPSNGEPVFEILSSWMTAKDYQEMTDNFQDIFMENLGEILLFQCVEKLREFVETKGLERQELEESCFNEVEETEQDIVESINDIKLVEYHYDSEINDIEITHGEPLTDRKSTFQAHLAFVTSRIQVDQVLTELKKNRKVANATHNVMAYRIYNQEKNTCIQDCDDNGENAAGSRLLHLLQITDVKNVVVIVTRWYGGLMLGPDRFKHYNNCARNLLQSAGLVENKMSVENNAHRGKSKTKIKKHK